MSASRRIARASSMRHTIVRIAWVANAVVTGLLAATFGVTILLLSAVLARFTQGQTIAVAASTLAVFALSQPVLRQVRRAVDRRFDRARYETTRRALLTTVVEAIQPRAAAVWIRASGRTR